MSKKLLIFLFLFLLASFAQALNVDINPSIAWQGKVMAIKISSAEKVASIEATFLNQTFNCYKNNDYFYGIVGVPVEQKTGLYPLDLTLFDNKGKEQTYSQSVEVKATTFPLSKFYLKPSRNKLRAPEIVNNEWAKIEQVLFVEDPVNQRVNRFIMPAQARISQGFGRKEIINDKPAGSHRGVDIAVPIGTKIAAPNNGRVVFADKLQAFGGTMVVDHGHGVQTLYFHLSKFIAKVGQEVEKGAVIALSGNSGISSGPHLHWGMSVHNLRVDPMQWVENQI